MKFALKSTQKHCLMVENVVERCIGL